MKTWVKLYTEINRDPDMGTLSWEYKGIWAALLALCGEIDDRDENEAETGKLDTVDRIAWRLRIDEQLLYEALEAFNDRGMIHFIGETVEFVYLTHYSDRQQRPPSAKPSATNERVRAHREAKRECNEDVTSAQRGVTPSDTDTDTDEKRKEPEVVTPVALVFRRWSDINPRRQVTPLDADMLNEMIADYGAPEVAEAIVKANAQGVPTLAYIGGVLKKNGQARSAPGKANIVTQTGNKGERGDV